MRRLACAKASPIHNGFPVPSDPKRHFVFCLLVCLAVVLSESMGLIISRDYLHAQREKNVSTDDVEAMRFQDIIACLLYCIPQRTEGPLFPVSETDCRS